MTDSSRIDELDLSIVLSGRNDNWMGLFDQVAPFACAHNVEILKRLGVSFEILFVEWAPLEDREPISTRLAAIDPSVRCLIVPRSIHDGFDPDISFLQYHARNVGIRRARGRVVIATNADILLTSSAARAALAIEDRCLLRAPRRDVSASILQVDDVDERSKWAMRPDHHVFTHDIQRPLENGINIPYWTNAAGDFVAMTEDGWRRCRGFHQRVDASLGVDAQLIHQAESLRIRIVACPSPIIHIDHAEVQPGRMNFPPYLRAGYDNPDDWGLGETAFQAIAPGIFRCPESAAGRFEKVTYKAPRLDGVPEPSWLVMNWLCPTTLGERLLIACQPIEATSPLMRKLARQSPSRCFVYRNPESPGAASVGPEPPRPETPREEGLMTWPAPPMPSRGALFVLSQGDPLIARLADQGGVEGRDYLVVDPHQQVTLSFLCRRLARSLGPQTRLILYGFGRNGAYLADALRALVETQQSEMLVFDDDSAARRRAIEAGLTIATEDDLVNRRDILLFTSSNPRLIQQMLDRRRRVDRQGEGVILIDRPDFQASNTAVGESSEESQATSRTIDQDPSTSLVEIDDFWTLQRDGVSQDYLDPALSSVSIEERRRLVQRVPPVVFWAPRITQEWPRGSFIEHAPFTRSARPDRSTPAWAGLLDPPLLVERRARAVIAELLPVGLRQVRELGRRAKRRRSKIMDITGRLLVISLVAQHGDHPVIHVGRSGSRVINWLAEGHEFLRGDVLATTVEPVLFPRGRRRSRRDHRPPIGKAPVHVTYLREHPEVAARMLSPRPLGALVFANLRSIPLLVESFFALTPLVQDGGHVLLRLTDSFVPSFVSEYLIRDTRFVPRLSLDGWLLLERVPRPSALAEEEKTPSGS